MGVAGDDDSTIDRDRGGPLANTRAAVAAGEDGRARIAVDAVELPAVHVPDDYLVRAVGGGRDWPGGRTGERRAPGDLRRRRRARRNQNGDDRLPTVTGPGA